MKKTNRVKENRDGQTVARCLEKVGEVCSGTENVMEYLIDAVKAGATLQEVCDVFRDVFWFLPGSRRILEISLRTVYNLLF